ncbi:MAG: LacI family transcriptional regulator [Opitutaceae bacterium]|jgi:DNA-binding LacI/PurR family transcriptional regulator|nr:LacI family transcriptional regulator [Opitutaceae bacterium]
MVTLKQIAEQAGVTTAAVSLALRGASNVSEEKKAEIRAIADALGYRRNPHVSTLMRHIRQGREIPRKATIAILFAHPSRTANKDIVFVRRRFQGMERRLAERGYRPEIFWYNDPDYTPERINGIFLARGIRGIVLAVYHQSQLDIRLDWENFAVSTQNDFIAGPFVHRVAEDYFANTAAAMTRLWESGCRRIGLAYNGKNARSAYFHITAAWQRFLSIAHGERDAAAVAGLPSVFIPPAGQWTEERFMAWFRNEKPDAILTFDWGDIPGWLAKAGVRVPEDTSVAVLNRCPGAPEFSGIDPEPERLGAMSVDLVIEQLESNEIGLPENPRILIIAGRWVQGRTTRAV